MLYLSLYFLSFYFAPDKTQDEVITISDIPEPAIAAIHWIRIGQLSEFLPFLGGLFVVMVPFFLEELTRSALEGGAEEGEEGEETVPGTVQGVLSARIDRLPEESKHLLRVASVLGEELPLDLLAAVWDRPAPAEPLLADLQRIGPLLADLQRAELLVPVPGDGAPRYAFRHALGRDVAYLALLDSRRRELHGAAGRALEAFREERGEEAYDRLAYHYARSGEPDKAVHHLLRFADRAARELTFAGHGRMFCLAGLGADVPGMIQTARDADVNVVVDGCPMECGRKTFDRCGVSNYLPVRVTDLGIEKVKGIRATDDQIAAVMGHVRQALADAGLPGA